MEANEEEPEKFYDNLIGVLNFWIEGSRWIQKMYQILNAWYYYCYISKYFCGIDASFIVPRARGHLLGQIYEMYR